jgi:hypothetical protein
MSEPMNKERMNSIFQEAKRRGLSEPEPGVNPRGGFTLTWTVGSTEIAVVFTPALYLTVAKADGDMSIDFNLSGWSDAEVVDRVELEIAKAAA